MALTAGCLGDAPTDHDDAHDHAASWTLQLEDCLEGGFVAVYPLGDDARLAGVWRLADIRDEVGNPLRDSLGMPLTGPARANWHQGFQCAQATLADGAGDASGAGGARSASGMTDFQFGFVGDAVEAPAWDAGGADLHFLVSGFGLQDSALRDALVAQTAADVTHALTARVDALTPAGPYQAVYTVYDDLEKGTYEAWGLIEPYRVFDARTIRLWWTVPADGSDSHLGHAHGDDEMPEGKWNPVYWDLATTGGARMVTPPDVSVELACHTGTPDHGPQGGACQPTLTLLQEHAAITITYGGIVHDVLLDEVWVH